MINKKFDTELPFTRDTSWVICCVESNNPRWRTAAMLENLNTIAKSGYQTGDFWRTVYSVQMR